MADAQSRLAELQALSDIADPVTAIPLLGELFDLCSDLGDSVYLQIGIAWATRLDSLPLTPTQDLTLAYFIGNAWLETYAQAVRASLRKPTDWFQPELETAVLSLRRVISHPHFESWHPVRRAQVLTNLGNALSTLGRAIDAIRMRDAAISTVPRFGMALGTRAETVLALANRLQLRKERSTYVAAAAAGFAASIASDAIYESSLYESVRDKWARRRIELEHYCAQHHSEVLSLEEVGNGMNLSPYVEWCLRERLKLNPLNDLGPVVAAISDSVHLPPIAPHDVHAELLFGLFDSITQEYVAARNLTHGAIVAPPPYYSEIRNVHDTGDDPIYGLLADQLKLGYRSAYSIFDKIAYFLKLYFAMDIKATGVSFARIWRNKSGDIRPEFANSGNWSLRGLYWVSRDLSEVPYTDVIEPEARALAKIRHHLEHRYLRLVRGACSTRIHDDLLVISIDEFKVKTLHLLRLARAAILTLVNAVAFEEHERGNRRGSWTQMPRLVSSQLQTETRDQP